VTVAMTLDEWEADIKTRGGDIGNVSQLRYNAFDFSGPLGFAKRAAGLSDRVGST
jgi:hypothetical protein